MIFWITSLRLSRCWTFSVVQTSMPAASSSSISCQRLGWRLPGMLVWAYSSTSSRPGLRRQRRVDVEFMQHAVAIDDRLARQHLEPVEQRLGFLRPWVSTRPATTSRPLAFSVARRRQHGVGLADAGRRAEKDLEMAAAFLLGERQQGFRRGSLRLFSGHGAPMPAQSYG